MIIKASFGDNNFTLYLEKFFKQFQFNLGYSVVDGKPDRLGTEDLLNGLGETLKDVLKVLDGVENEPLGIFDLEDETAKEKKQLRFKETFDYRHFNELYHKDKITVKDKKFICDYIKDKIILYLKLNNYIKNSETLNYLENSLVVSLPSMVKDDCENEKSVYYFVGSDTFVTL